MTQGPDYHPWNDPTQIPRGYDHALELPGGGINPDDFSQFHEYQARLAIDRVMLSRDFSVPRSVGSLPFDEEEEPASPDEKVISHLEPAELERYRSLQRWEEYVATFTSAERLSASKEELEDTADRFLDECLQEKIRTEFQALQERNTWLSSDFHYLALEKLLRDYERYFDTRWENRTPQPSDELDLSDAEREQRELNAQIREHKYESRRSWLAQFLAR